MFLSYLLQQLLIQRKPVVQFGQFSSILYCSEGVFEVNSNDFDPSFVMAQDDEWVKSLTLLMDANYVNLPGQPRYIPIVNAVREGWMGPRVVYTTSPDLHTVKNALISNLSGKFQIRIMNPWTPFEIEIM